MAGVSDAHRPGACVAPAIRRHPCDKPRAAATESWYMAVIYPNTTGSGGDGSGRLPASNANNA